MAWYRIQHSCGHEQDHKMTCKMGNADYRARRAEWLASQDCTDCWGEEQRRARDAAGPQAYLRYGKGWAEVVVINAYTVKDSLKERGYKFDEYAVGDYDFLHYLPKGWGKVFDLPDQAEGARAEIEWSEAQGWQLHMEHPLRTLMLAPLDGRTLGRIVEAERSQTTG